MIRDSIKSSESQFQNFDPPIGFVPSIVLTAINDLGESKASGASAIAYIESRVGRAVQAPQVYAAVKKLLVDGLIEKTGDYDRSTNPPRQLYRLTKAGHDARTLMLLHVDEIRAFHSTKGGADYRKETSGESADNVGAENLVDPIPAN